MVTFKVNNNEYANHILAGTYDVAREPVYKEWIDANQKKHKKFMREGKIIGSFSMFFRTMNEYQAFISNINTKTSVNGDYVQGIVITDNKSGTVRNIDAWLTFRPIRNRDGKWNDYFDVFTVNIEER